MRPSRSMPLTRPHRATPLLPPPPAPVLTTSPFMALAYVPTAGLPCTIVVNVLNKVRVEDAGAALELAFQLCTRGTWVLNIPRRL